MTETTKEHEFSKETLIEQKARELLKNKEVENTTEALEQCINYVNNTGKFDQGNDDDKNIEEKYNRFLGLGKYGHETETNLISEKQKYLLRDFWKEMEAEDELKVDEVAALDRITNDKLLINPEIVEEIRLIILKAQEIRLKEDKKIADQTLKTEIKHITQVTELSKLAFPELPILQLSSASHDAYKYVAPGYYELGLHELASTILGSKLVEQALRKYQTELDLNLEEIDLIIKLVRRAIFTHGNYEFTEANAEPILEEGQTKLKRLFGGLYPEITKRSVDYPLPRTPNSTQLTIAAQNFLDALTGTNLESFAKYNDASIGRIKNFETLSEYFNKSLFASFDGNMTMPAGAVVVSNATPELQKVVGDNQLVKGLLDLAITENWGELKKLVKFEKDAQLIEIEYSTLKEIFQKLKETQQDEETQLLRDQFGTQIRSFFLAVHHNV